MLLQRLDDQRRNARATRAERGSGAFALDLAPGLLLILELIAIFWAGIVSWIFVAWDAPEYLPQYLFCIALVALTYGILCGWVAGHSILNLLRPFRSLEDSIISLITAMLFLISLIYGLDARYFMVQPWPVVFGVSAIALLAMIRGLAWLALRRLRRSPAFARRVVVLGATQQSARFVEKFYGHATPFTDLLGVFTLEPHPIIIDWAGKPILGGLEDLYALAREGRIDDVVVGLPWSADEAVVAVIERLKELPINVFLTSDLVGFDLAFRPGSGAYSALPVFEVMQRPIAGWSYALKVTVDYLLASALVALLLPLLLLIALAIKLDSPGPVFFLQQRLGFNNGPFMIYKFRSMYHAPRRDGPVQQATRNDPRVTRVGRIIRATSLDELPQLLNVLTGTMSLVGPRPHATSHNEEYGKLIRGYFARHKVKPGITGWAQVSGFRGETVEIEKMRQRVQHDIYYAENWSLLFDIKILFKTIIVVFFQKSAY